MKDTYDTIIVGGGIAGLTATVYLAREGQKVLLIEKNREPGGLVNSFSRNGFHFDAGVRAIEDAGIILPMLKDLKIDLQVVKSPVSVGIENEILNIENLESLAEYKDLLKKLYPDSSQEIDEVVKTIRRIMKHMDVLYGIENPLFKDLKRDTSFIFKKLIPWFPKFLLTIGKINRMQIPVEDYLNSVVKNPSLRDIISQHFFKNTPTFFALSYFSLYLDYFYPRGGVGKLSEALNDKIAELGGEIKTGIMVTGLSPDNKTVTGDNNISYKYKNLVWAADLKTLYRIADTENLATDIKMKFEDVKARMLRNKGGDSVFTLFLQIDEPLESFGKIANGHFFYTPSRHGLGETHRQELGELLNSFHSTTRQQVLDWLDRFLSLNTFEISIPGLKDKDLVPPGKTGMIISFLADYELFKKIEDAGWIEQFISEVENRVLRVISESIYPILKDKVIDRFSFSPLNIHNRTASSEGAIVGWEFQKEMPVINKIQIADRSVLTPLPSVYQAGQWAYSPAGVPMSILTGKLAANKILKTK
ncbi:MAG: NAD(P)/FAD-dependent oxidoreductase [Marinilabiliales bacterium]|nr:MAG: NAD(P)/FAD-dependent oxidoreductase [Marinilabiliales bacterium]